MFSPSITKKLKNIYFFFLPIFHTLNKGVHQQDGKEALFYVAMEGDCLCNDKTHLTVL